MGKDAARAFMRNLHRKVKRQQICIPRGEDRSTFIRAYGKMVWQSMPRIEKQKWARRADAYKLSKQIKQLMSSPPEPEPAADD